MNDTLMQDTIRDVLATMPDVNLTEIQEEEIKEEIFATEEWAAVMGKIAEMIHETNNKDK